MARRDLMIAWLDKRIAELGRGESPLLTRPRHPRAARSRGARGFTSAA
ncbi:MAG: hypothetical protein M0C28_02780 [Candidatus Moduliflexus flocculans]|nr:hypothetical protein [Candidatus Moduliflexus flocculans]